MEVPEISEGLRKNLIYLGVSLLIVVSIAGAKNVMTPEEPVKVGYTEVHTECAGIEAGVCIGVQLRDHKTYNYDNYTKVEPGTPNFYRRVESELMAQAYNTCTSDMEGYEWTSKVSYRNKTGDEWRQNENIQLLPCEKTFYRKLNATK